MVQEPRTRFHVPEWGVFCHTERLRNRPLRLKLVLSDGATDAYRGYATASKAVMAEEQGFEPWEDFHPRRFSRPVHSTTLPLLRQKLT